MSYDSFLSGRPITNPLDAAIDRIQSEQRPVISDGMSHKDRVNSLDHWPAWHRLSDLESRIETFGKLDAASDDPDDVNALMELQREVIALLKQIVQESRTTN